MFRAAIKTVLAAVAVVCGLLASVHCSLVQAGALDWESKDGYRRARLPVPATGRAGFTSLPAEQTGLTFTNRLSDAALASNQVLEIGSGVALGDVDGDGWVDIYLCALQGGNQLFRNRGNWSFENITVKAGVGCPGQFSTGAVFADTDGDGDLDLLVNSIGGGTRLFINDGAGRFQEATGAGLHREGGCTSLALGDIDGDGYLDLYVANYKTRTVKDSPGLAVDVRTVNGQVQISPPGLFLPLFLKSGGVSLFERAEPDVLYLNDGHGGFAPVPWTSGRFLDANGQAMKEVPRDWALTVLFRDLNGDNVPDIYVCNDFFYSPDHIWLSDASGKYQAAGPLAFRHTSMSSMAGDFADINRDGYDDLLVTDMMSRDHQLRQRQRGSLIHVQAQTAGLNPLFRPEYPRNTLFLNRGDGTFAEIAQQSGVEASEWSWSTIFMDVDLDGYEDLLVTTGTLRDANDADASKGSGSAQRSAMRPNHPNLRFSKLETPNLIFRNRGDLTFEECGARWGFDTTGVSHGMAVADLDNDGDLDVVVNHMQQAVGVYRNDSVAPRVAVRLKGAAPNLQGIGAKVRLHGGAVALQSQEIICGGRYLSGDDPLRVFAAGANAMRLEVVWRSGGTSVVDQISPNFVYEVAEGAHARDARGRTNALAVSAPSRINWSEGVTLPIFTNMSEILRQPHQQPESIQPERQPLLPGGLGRLGPGLSWNDYDGDGWDDLMFGSGKGGVQVLYLNNRKGGFQPVRRRDLAAGNQAAILGWPKASGGMGMLLSLLIADPKAEQTSAVFNFDLSRDVTAQTLAFPWSVGALSIGLLGDKPALVVAGRMQPGHYPEAVSSRVYTLTDDEWVLDVANSERLKGVGLVTGATWSDLTGDGAPDLVLACEWGPIRVFENSQGVLVERTGQLGLDRYRGLWTGVAAGDFNNDGRLDLVAANRGRNTKYQRHLAQPIRLYFGDFSGTGQVDTMEAYYDPALRGYVPFLTLDVLREHLPGLAARFESFAAYARATVEEILGEAPRKPTFLEGNWLDSTLFLNRGTYFDAIPLPAEAQFSPGFGVSIGDMDGDGNEDAFLSQNLFDVGPEETRSDAGRGLWLKGDGAGGLTPVPGQESGVKLYGEQRGCALCDFDQDGRVDLAVAENGWSHGLFRNTGGRPGLRVRLRGSRLNPAGIGAILRIRYADRLGPARAMPTGSGYWSQESAVQVLGLNGAPTHVDVRWQGGEKSLHPVPDGTREITISWPE